jgi:hypothetical protein
MSRMNRSFTFGVAPALSLTVAAFLASGCGDDEDDPQPINLGEGAAFVVGTRIWDDTTTLSYFHVVPSLDANTLVDPKQGLEVPGAAKLYSVKGLGWFAIGGGEAPTITRYTLDERGALARGQSIDLSGYGVKGLWDTIYFVSPTKAYYPDREGTQLIVWNPSTMRVIGNIQLPETVRDGYLALYGYTPVVRGTKLLFSIGWFDWSENDSVLPETGLVSIDTESDTLAAFETDERCGGITQTIAMSDGDAYFVSSALAGTAHLLGRLATEPCALRIRHGEEAFDGKYVQPLAALTEGGTAGEPIPGGQDTVFLRVLDESLATIEDGAFTYDLTGQAAWHWVRWTPASNTIESIDSLDPSSSDVLWFEIDGKIYGSQTTTEYTETTLIELTAEGGPRVGLTAPGFVHGVARVR